jgi:Spy/CpxP family protein refolding chaperone
MKKILSPKTIFLFLLVFAAAEQAVAQIGPPAGADQPTSQRRLKAKRPNLLRILGLSPSQAQQIRRINQQRKPQMEAAQNRLHAANQALDAAIYADQVDQEMFQTRLKEQQQAQADLARLRFTSELAVRMVLTPDQIARFRDLRQRFAQPMPVAENAPIGVDDRGPTPRRMLRRVP